jgi:hypothetical protein
LKTQGFARSAPWFAAAAKGAYANALFYERQADRSYRLAAEAALLNPVAPIDLLLGNSGYLIAFDNWHNMGYGKAVAIYGPDGVFDLPTGKFTLFKGALECPPAR